MCGIAIIWHGNSQVDGVCHGQEIPDLACIDCAVLEEILHASYPIR